MVEKNNENLNRKDLDLILEVNRKTIEIQTAVADQNEEVISYLSENKDTQKNILESLDKLKDITEREHKYINDKLSKIQENTETTNKELFKTQVLFVTGLLSFIVQIIQAFLKK